MAPKCFKAIRVVQLSTFSMLVQNVEILKFFLSQDLLFVVENETDRGKSGHNRLGTVVIR